MKSNRNKLTVPLAIFLIVVLSMTLHASFWHMPLLALDALKTSFQDENFSDQNFYLSVAAELCRSPEWTSDDLYVTWSSTGVIGYLAYGCETFGSEYFYIVLNPLLVSLSFGSVLWAAGQIGLTPRISLATLLSIPYTLLTLSLPGKEVISMTGTLFCIAGLLLLEKHHRRLLGAFSIVCGLGIIATNRIHEAVAISFFILLWRTGVLKSVWRILILLAITSYCADYVLKLVLIDQGAVSITDKVLWSGSSEGKSFELDAIFDLLRSDSLFVHSILGVLRVIVVLVSPLSSLVTPLTQSDTAYFIFRDLSQRLRLVDWFLISFTLWRFVRSSGTLKPNYLRRLNSLMPLLFLFMIYVISFFGVTQKSRYIFQYTPLLLLWLWLFTPDHRSVAAEPLGLTDKPNIYIAR